ncbi:cyclin-D3-2 [Malania oleifera]|uniref:cyclin-D3-2 n=1 Tax=Malania oleifera TaxID=397392 RepID=UPI0025AEC52D|nr:cyclin-D3-2 [Malania oleifera]
MALRQEEEQLQNPPFHLDGLYCEEERFEDDSGDDGFGEKSQNCDDHSVRRPSISDLCRECEDDELVSLMLKEEQCSVCYGDLKEDAFLMAARAEAVWWMLRVNDHYGFSALTAVLAVNYFDRFMSSLRFQRDKPWMTQLIAVACLSLAAKVEETRVPLLLDLQVEVSKSKYLFEAKTIQKVELLVLSTLNWKMNPLTPFNFLDHFMRRVGMETHLTWEFLWRCERLILCVIADSRIVCYPPSVIATATMLHAIKEVKPCNLVEFQNQLVGVLKISKDKVDECYKLILDLSSTQGQSLHQPNKRKRHVSTPGSPNGVISATFSCDSSNDSWAVASSVSSSPEPLFKKSRALDQQMRLTPLNRLSVNVLSSPR